MFTNRIFEGVGVWKKHPFVFIFLGFLIVFSLLSISCTKRFVGRSVSTYHWCKAYSFPATCSRHDNWFLWEYTVETGNRDKEFIVKGFADGGSGAAKSFNQLLPSKSNFYVVLAYNNKVVDSFIFGLPAAKVNSPIPFKKAFTCENKFDAVTIYWEAWVR
jgi:hypothetical protein